MVVTKMKKNILKLFIFILPFTIWCNIGFATDEIPDYWPTKGWRTASPESQGVDSKLLIRMLETIWENDIDIDSVLVIRNGYIVLDAYSYPYEASHTRNIYSCTKSVLSALVGIAIDKGYIKDVNQHVLDFFSKRVAKNITADKKAMTFEDLLTMTTGLKCHDSYRYNWSGLMEMKWSTDWVQFMIDLPMAEVPGTRFEYCNGASFLLSAILQEQTGMDALSFAEENLFVPLGISRFSWPSNPQGITFGYARLYMRPQDMAKIGYLYLSNGLWDGKQIISSRWIKDSTRKHVSTRGPFSYGYQWWTTNSGEYIAIGYGGQYIFVVPDKNMIVVFTSHLSQRDMTAPTGLLYSDIILSVKSDKALPENPQDEKALKAIMALWQNTSPVDREKIREKAEKTFPSQLPGEYVNNEYGFSVRYDPKLIITDHDTEPQAIFRKKAVGGLPIFGVAVNDIPQAMVLKGTGDYLMGIYRKIFEVKNPEILKQELITLSNGTQANYVEITWGYRSFDMVTVAVIVYKDDKMISVAVVGNEEMPKEYLAGMAKSLRFKN